MTENGNIEGEVERNVKIPPSIPVVKTIRTFDLEGMTLQQVFYMLRDMKYNEALKITSLPPIFVNKSIGCYTLEIDDKAIDYGNANYMAKILRDVFKTIMISDNFWNMDRWWYEISI